MRKLALNRNHYFVFGFLLGLFLSFYIPENIWDLVQNECPQSIRDTNLLNKFDEDFEPHLNLINKPLAAKKPVKNVIRPRYYSSELGIREKIFIGVMTSKENINTLATAINRTAAHLVNKIKFFINADNIKTNFKLKNIVGFTDARESLRPFHVIKYIADNYLDDFDYFLIIPDTLYIDARKLKELLYHMSVTFDIYMGKSAETSSNNYNKESSFEDHNNHNNNNNNNENENIEIQSDRNYCDLNAGILLSSSVIRKMRNNLDWCVRNGITNVHSVNIGRCVKYSSKLSGCQETFQGMRMNSFEFQDSIKIFKDLSLLSMETKFQNATIVYPVTNIDDYYRLHAYFSRYHLDKLKTANIDLEKLSYRIANGTISNNILNIRWPLGVQLSSTPESRHDLIPWQFLNQTHLFEPLTDNVVQPLSRIDSEDFQTILGICIKYSKHKYPDLNYANVHTVYRRYDPTRGMDYHLHLNLVKKNNKIVTKSFHVVKPLGRVEVIPSPYVTESTRIALLVPTFEHQIAEGLNFVKQYESICMKNQDNTFLMMIFMYRNESSSKGDTDPFKDIKTLALDLSMKYKNDGSRIAWVSIRLPPIFSEPFLPDDIMLNSMYARNEILSLVATDLTLPKIGLDSLVLLSTNSMVFKADFLNRVRMNTIQGFQIYSPIGFMTYPCKFADFCKECESCDVSQSSGYFDRYNDDVISFYSRDYVQARKKLEEFVPIIKSDNDIETLLNRADKTVNNVLDIFVKAQLPIHILRGHEPNLRFGQTIKNYLQKSRELPKCPAKYRNKNNYSNEIPLRYSLKTSSSLNLNKCIHIAARKQIGNAIIRYEDKTIGYSQRKT